MIQIKKTILTLVALIAISTGAWATEKMVTINSGTMSSGAVTATGFINLFDNLIVGGDPATITTSEGVITKLVIKKGTIYEDDFTEDNVGVAPGTITYGSDEITVTDINAESVTLSRKGINNWSPSSVDVYYGASSGPEVAWNAASKTGTFDMPGGNVELEPEYYPQATAAEGAVTAATDVKATTDAPLVTIDETKLIGAAKMMYYVSTDATAPAYDAVGWTDELPTAEKFTEAGNVNVWYYPVGTDENVGGATATYSDGDMNATALTVNIAAAPTYAVTFADDLAEPTEWTASPATDVTKGQTVTVTYTGTKKVLGVKAEKKASAPAEKNIKIDGQDYTVLNGETWKQFITRNQLSGWDVTQMTLYTWGVYIDEPYSELHVSSDGTNWTQLVLSSQDAPIDTDKQYKWVQEELGGGVGGGEPLF